MFYSDKQNRIYYHDGQQLYIYWPAVAAPSGGRAAAGLGELGDIWQTIGQSMSAIGPLLNTWAQGQVAAANRKPTAAQQDSMIAQAVDSATSLILQGADADTIFNQILPVANAPGGGILTIAASTRLHAAVDAQHAARAAVSNAAASNAAAAVAAAAAAANSGLVPLGQVPDVALGQPPSMLSSLFSSQYFLPAAIVGAALLLRR